MSMFTFIKEAIKEIEHVVWPTQAETRKYFVIVTLMIVSATIVLAVVGSGLTTWMQALRNIVPRERVAPATTEDSGARAAQIIEQLNTSSGASVTPATQSGATLSATGTTTPPKTQSGATTTK